MCHEGAARRSGIILSAVSVCIGRVSIFIMRRGARPDMSEELFQGFRSVLPNRSGNAEP